MILFHVILSRLIWRHRVLSFVLLSRLVFSFNRRIGNHQALAAALEAKFGDDFVNISLERTSIFYQYHIFKSAQLVIGQVFIISTSSYIFTLRLLFSSLVIYLPTAPFIVIARNICSNNIFIFVTHYSHVSIASNPLTSPFRFNQIRTFVIISSMVLLSRICFSWTRRNHTLSRFDLHPTETPTTSATSLRFARLGIPW